MRIGEAERLHWAVTQRFATALGHHLDRQTAIEIGRRRFEIAELDLLAGEQRIDKRLVLRARERAIDVVGAGACRPRFVVARLEPGDVEIDRLAVHDRREGIEESERGLAGERADRIGERWRGERAGGDDDAVPVRRQGGNFLAADIDERLVRKRRGNGRGKAIAVDGERASRRQLVGIGRAHHQRAKPPHLGVQETDRARRGVVGAERIRANELGELPGLVHGGRAQRPHFVQHHRHAAARDLPGGLGTRQARRR